MKRVIRFGFIVIFCFFIVNLTSICLAGDIVPPFLSQGLDNYKNGEEATLLQSILANSVLKKHQAEYANRFNSLEEDKGNYKGWEKLAGCYVSESQNLAAIRIMMKYEKAPMYLYCICYKTGEQWILSELIISDTASDVLSWNNLG